MSKFILSLFFSIFCLVSISYAQNSDELKRKQADIQREIDELRATLKATQKNKKASLGELALVKKKLRLREEAINNISDQINQIQTNIYHSRSEINKIIRELDTLKIQYLKSVEYAYKNRSNYDLLNFVFSASNFNDAIRRAEYLKTYRNYRQQQAETIRNTQILLKNKIVDLEKTKKEKDNVLHKQEKEKLVLVEEQKEKDEVVKSLKAREKEINKELTAKAKADKALKSGIAAAIRREQEKIRQSLAAGPKLPEAPKNNIAGTSNASGAKPERTKSILESTPEGLLVSENFEKNKGRLPWPVEKGRIKIGFGTYTIEGVSSVHGNNPGLTIETEDNAAVKSVFGGDVITVFDVEGVSAVLIKHGKYFTSYSNLSNVTVSKGQKINAGQVLGKAVANGDGNGEIEFLLMKESANIDPEPWIRR